MLDVVQQRMAHRRVKERGSVRAEHDHAEDRQAHSGRVSGRSGPPACQPRRARRGSVAQRSSAGGREQQQRRELQQQQVLDHVVGQERSS